MKPTSLAPGDRVTNGSYVLTFIERVRNFPRPAVNVFQCDAFRGLNGPGDTGISHASDYYVSRRMTLVERAKEAKR
jgi:hypothetical protein